MKKMNHLLIFFLAAFLISCTKEPLNYNLILADAQSLLWMVDSHQEKLEQFDPAVDCDGFRALLEQIEAEDIGFSSDWVPVEVAFTDRAQEEKAAPLIEKLIEHANRVRAAGKEVFKDDPESIWLYLTCSAPNAEYVSVDLEIRKENPDEVYFINLGDTPKDDYLFEQLDTLHFFRNVYALWFYGIGLTNEEIERIDLTVFPNLTSLDFSENAFTTIPPSVLDCTNLQELSLKRNPIRQIPQDISKLKKLRMLDLSRTDLTAEQIKAVEKQLPGCKIKAGVKGPGNARPFSLLP